MKFRKKKKKEYRELGIELGLKILVSRSSSWYPN